MVGESIPIRVRMLLQNPDILIPQSITDYLAAGINFFPEREQKVARVVVPLILALSTLGGAYCLGTKALLFSSVYTKTISLLGVVLATLAISYSLIKLNGVLPNKCETQKQKSLVFGNAKVREISAQELRRMKMDTETAFISDSGVFKEPIIIAKIDERVWGFSLKAGENVRVPYIIRRSSVDEPREQQQDERAHLTLEDYPCKIYRGYSRGTDSTNYHIINEANGLLEGLSK